MRVSWVLILLLVKRAGIFLKKEWGVSWIPAIWAINGANAYFRRESAVGGRNRILVRIKRGARLFPRSQNGHKSGSLSIHSIGYAARRGMIYGMESNLVGPIELT